MTASHTFRHYDDTVASGSAHPDQSILPYNTGIPPFQADHKGTHFRTTSYPQQQHSSASLLQYVPSHLKRKVIERIQRDAQQIQYLAAENHRLTKSNQSLKRVLATLHHSHPNEVAAVVDAELVGREKTPKRSPRKGSGIKKVGGSPVMTNRKPYHTSSLKKLSDLASGTTSPEIAMQSETIEIKVHVVPPQNHPHIEVESRSQG